MYNIGRLFYFQNSKAKPWSKSKSCRIFHNAKRSLKDYLKPVAKSFSVKSMWIECLVPKELLTFSLISTLTFTMTLQCLVVDGHEMERYVCLRCCLIFDMKDKVVLDHYLGFTLSSHHNFDLPVTLIWPWPWSDLEQGLGFHLSLRS